MWASPNPSDTPSVDDRSALTQQRYGYRVYKLSVGRRNSWRNPESLTDLGEPFAGQIHSLLLAAKDRILKYLPDLAVGDGSIKTPASGSDVGEPVMVITDVWRDDRLIRCEVVAGTYGDHDELVGEQLEKITDRAAGRRYFIDLYFPKDGMYGMAVAETCKQYTPIDHLLRWVAWLQIDNSLKSLASDPSAAQESAEAPSWRKFRVNQVADRDYLLDLISKAKRVDVDLVQAGGMTARGRHRKVQKKLSFVDVEQGVHAALADEIAGWLEPDQAAASKAVKRVMRALNLSPSKLQKDGLSFNNTSVHLESTQVVSVSPGTVRDLFTYGLADYRVDDHTFELRTRAKLLELAGLESVDLAL